MGQRALACDDCDKWCHKSCLEMNTIEFDELANNSLPWYCPSCNSLNRTTVVYDLPTVDYCTHIVNSTSIQPQTPAKSDGNLIHLQDQAALLIARLAYPQLNNNLQYSQQTSVIVNMTTHGVHWEAQL